MQQFLKAACRAARTWIVPAEPFRQIFLGMHSLVSALYVSF